MRAYPEAYALAAASAKPVPPVEIVLARAVASAVPQLTAPAQ